MDMQRPETVKPENFKSIQCSGYNYQVNEISPEIINPVFPFTPFFIPIEDEIFIELNNDIWWTLEICRFKGEWFNLDADTTGEQVLGINDNFPGELYENIPLKNYSNKIELKESEKKKYEIKYQSITGDEILIFFEVISKSFTPEKRNGSTMGHSDELIWALVDLEEIASGKVKVMINGKKANVKYLVPFFIRKAFKIKQTIVGIPSEEGREFSLGSDGSRFKNDSPDESVVKFTDILSDDYLIEYYFYENSKIEFLELFSVRGIFENKEIVNFEFSPSVPDLRFIYPEDEWSGRFAVSINGIFGYSTGRVEIVNEFGKTYMNIIPEEPYWSANRIIQIKFTFSENKYIREINIIKK
ncbi:MAG: hypothetical protein PHV06_06145 [bacterium]|nr:hypothetical protein [bacterium]